MHPRYSEYLAAALFISGAHAVDFTSYRGLSCRGEVLAENRAMYPYRCVSAGSDASSIIAHGLQNKNNADAYIELYSDLNCKEYRTTVKYSQICVEANFQSAILFIPAISKEAEADALVRRNETLEDIRNAPFDQLTAEQQSQMDEELEAALLALQQEYEPSSSDSQKRGEKIRLGLSLLPVRAAGDRHVADGDSNISGIEVDDDNSPGDSAGFSFANNNQRGQWATTVFTRLMDDRRNHPGNELYTGAQTVNNHDLEVDIELRSGTLGETALATFRNWISMFARQRDNHSHQVWNLYVGSQLLAVITFKAFRIG